MNAIPQNPSDSLRRAAQCIEDRASERDLPHERSMARAVSAFCSLTGHNLSETDGWLFMIVLKLSRATVGKLVADDWIDGAAYCALALESASINQHADDRRSSTNPSKTLEDLKAEMEACYQEYVDSAGSLP